MGLGPITVGITADASKFASTAKSEIDRAIPTLEFAGKEMGRVIGAGITAGIALGIAGIGVAIAGAVTALGSFTMQGVALADGLAEASAKLGIGASSLLAFQEVAKLTGVEMSTMEQALGKMNVKMGEALLGNDAAIQSFSQLGLSVQSLAMLSPEAQFQAISNAINSIPDASIRAAMAVDVFGKTGMQLIPVFAELNATSDEMASRWEMLSAVITDAQIQAAASVADRIDMVSQTFDRFKILLAAEMAPLLVTALDYLDNMVISAGGLAPAAEVAGQWMEMLAGYIIDAGQLLQGMGYILVGLGEIAGNFKESWKFATENFSAYMDVAIGNSLVGFATLIDFAYSQFVFMAEQLPDIFQIAAMGIVATLSAAFKWIVKGLSMLHSVATGAIVWQTPSMEIAPKIVIPQQTEIGRQLKDYGQKLSKEGSAAINSSLADNPLMKGIGDTFNKGMSSFDAVLGGGEGRWSTGFMADVAAQRALDAASIGATGTGAASGPAKSTNQQLIDQRNAWQSAVFPATAPRASVNLPGNVARNIDSVGSGYSQPVNVNHYYQSGATKQQIAGLEKSIERRTVTAVQKKVAQGGNYRREMQC